MEIPGILGMLMGAGAIGTIGVIWCIFQFLKGKETEIYNENLHEHQRRVMLTGSNSSRGLLYVDDKMYKTFDQGMISIDSLLKLDVIYDKTEAPYGVLETYYEGQTLSQFLASGSNHQESMSQTMEVLEKSTG